MNRLPIAGHGPSPGPSYPNPAPSARPSVRRRGVAAALVLAVAVAIATGPAAQERRTEAPTESQIKAAYVHRFLGFVEWPASQLPSSATPLRIGVVGAEAVLAELERLVAGRPIDGRPVEVQRVAADTPPGLQLHVVYVGDDRVPGRRTLEALRDLPVLTVADGSWGADAGAMLSFVPQDGRIRFQASLPAAERAGLRLNARLLGVAVRVIGAPP